MSTLSGYANTRPGRTKRESGTVRADNVVDLRSYRAKASRHPRLTVADDRSTQISIAIDAEGFLDYESHIRSEDADRVTDVLLLMIVRARQACAE